MRKATFPALGLLWLGFVAASDPPDSEINPQSGYVEIVDTVSESSNGNIRRAVDTGPGQPNEVEIITTDATDDLDPKVTITDNGDTWVVWWRDKATDEVLLVRHDYSVVAWSSEELVSTSNESSSAPAIVNDGTEVWIAYEYISGSDTGIAVAGGVNEPSPWPSRTVIDMTTYSGTIDVQIHGESAQLWVSWVDSTTHVGWSEYDSTTEAWSSTSTEWSGRGSVDSGFR